MKKTIIQLLATGCLTIVTVGTAIISRWLFPSVIIYYEFLIISTICFTLFLFTGIITRKYLLVTVRDIVMTCLLSVVSSYAIFITVPALLDRSISLYIVAVLSKENAGTIEQINRWFVDGFVYENEAIPKRLNEQVVSGNVVEIDGCYYLTERGKRMMAVNRSLVKIFQVDPRYSNPINYRNPISSQLQKFCETRRSYP